MYFIHILCRNLFKGANKYMEDIEHKIDILKQLLYTKIDSNNNIISAEILRLSQELDDLIVDAYKKQLNLT